MIRVTLLIFFALSCLASTCYYPNGNPAPNDSPCNASALQSTCCGPTYACLSNNICMATGLTPQTSGSTTYVRGSCTDQSWQSGSGPLFCINPSYDDTAGGEGIAKCPNTNLDLYYCIDGATSNCSVHQNVLSFAGTPTFVKNPAATSTTTTTSSPSSTMSTTITSSALSSAAASSMLTSSPTSSTAVSSSPSPSPNSNGTSSTSVAIGAGVGVPLGVIALAFLIYLPLRYKQQQNKKHAGSVPDEHIGKEGNWNAPHPESKEMHYGRPTIVEGAPPGFPPQEVESERLKYELGGESRPQELPTSS